MGKFHKTRLKRVCCRLMMPLLLFLSGLLQAGEAEDYYVANVEALVQGKCIACHRVGGVGSPNLIFSSSATANHRAFDGYVNTPTNGANASKVLSKITGELGHGGGVQIIEGSAEYQTFSNYMDLLSAAGPASYTVVPSAGRGGSISPSDPVLVNVNDTTSFVVTANEGYELNTVGGTCGGSMSGVTYITSAVVGDCTVEATFRATVDGGADQRARAIPTMPSISLLIMSGVCLLLGALHLRARVLDRRDSRY